MLFVIVQHGEKQGLQQHTDSLLFDRDAKFGAMSVSAVRDKGGGGGGGGGGGEASQFARLSHSVAERCR